MNALTSDRLALKVRIRKFLNMADWIKLTFQSFMTINYFKIFVNRQG